MFAYYTLIRLIDWRFAQRPAPPIRLLCQAPGITFGNYPSAPDRGSETAAINMPNAFAISSSYPAFRRPNSQENLGQYV